MMPTIRRLPLKSAVFTHFFRRLLRWFGRPTKRLTMGFFTFLKYFPDAEFFRLKTGKENIMNELKKEKSKILRVAMIGMLCALAYIAVAFGRIPVVLFLKYDPKDVIIALGGLSLGPAAAALISLIVSFLEMITISEDGVIGFLMNVISTCSFACIASIIYKKKHDFKGAVLGLFSGWLSMIILMILWNWIITPLYMGIPRSAVVDLLIPAFLPFNFVKGGLNMSLTLILYKPIMLALRRSHLPIFDNVELSELSSAPLNKSPRFRFKAIFAALPILAVSVVVMIWLMTNS